MLPALNPFCAACLEGEAPCAACAPRLAEQGFVELDYRFAKALHSLRRDYPLDEAGFERTLEFVPFTAVLTKTPSALIGKGGRVAKRLAEILGKPVKIVDSGASPEKQFNELMLPVRVLGVNKVYSPAGERVKIRIRRDEAHRLPVRVQDAERLARKFFGENSELVLE